MTTKQAGEYLDVTPGRIRQYIHDGVLVPEKAGQVNLIPDKQVHKLKRDLLKRDPSKTGPKPKVMKQASPRVPTPESSDGG